MVFDYHGYVLGPGGDNFPVRARPERLIETSLNLFLALCKGHFSISQDKPDADPRHSCAADMQSASGLSCRIVLKINFTMSLLICKKFVPDGDTNPGRLGGTSTL